MAYGDAGLAHEHWKLFYTPGEVAEIIAATSSTMIVAGHYPIHVRLYVHSLDAPTVIMSHPMLPYGLLLARLQLPFYRAGFNVVQWDLPGWGQSGGPRANCPIPDFIRTWRAAIAFTRTRFTGPLYAMGLAEDSVGPPWLVRAKALGVGLGARFRPDLALQAEDALPWRAIFSGPDDGPLLRAFEGDPLRVRRFHFLLVGSMMGKVAPPVPLEQCRTPVQVIASEKSSLWPYAMNVRYFNRLGGPKELVTLNDSDQWVYTREFHEMYANHVIRWFTAHGAKTEAQ